MTNRLRRASRPTSIRNPISSRRVSVTSAMTACPASTTEVCTTGRCSTSPEELLTSRVATTAASAMTESAVERCHGWTSKRTQGLPSRSNHSSPNACSDDVRAPVSTLAFMWATSQTGSDTHSRHPSVIGSGRLAGDTGARYRPVDRHCAAEVSLQSPVRGSGAVGDVSDVTVLRQGATVGLVASVAGWSS